MLDKEAIERARQDLEAAKTGGPLRGLPGGAELTAQLRAARSTQGPPESCTFVDVPPTQENPTGKIMLRNVVVNGFESTFANNLIAAIVNGVASVVTNAVTAHLLSYLSPRLKRIEEALHIHVDEFAPPPAPDEHTLAKYAEAAQRAAQAQAALQEQATERARADAAADRLEAKRNEVHSAPTTGPQYDDGPDVSDRCALCSVKAGYHERMEDGTPSEEVRRVIEKFGYAIDPAHAFVRQDLDAPETND